MTVWYRICVDIDRAGHPIGASLERHEGELITRVEVAAPDDIGPFDPAVATFNWVLDTVPLQMALFD